MIFQIQNNSKMVNKITLLVAITFFVMSCGNKDNNLTIDQLIAAKNSKE